MRRYNYTRDHELCEQCVGGSFDHFFSGMLATAWTFWHGYVAEQTKYLEKLCGIWRSLVEDAGGDVTVQSMDKHRFLLHSCPVYGNHLLAAGLESQVEGWQRVSGVHRWPNDCLSRVVDFYCNHPVLKGTADNEEGVRTIVEFTFAFACFECSTQSESSSEQIRAILRGAAADRPSGPRTSGVEDLTALNNGAIRLPR